MDLSVILICHNSAKDIKPCLDSVLAACASYHFEVLVVDNGSKDESVTLLQSYGPKVYLICNSGNQGVAKARNQALKEAIGEFIWILDIDTEVNKMALDKMFNLCSVHPEIGICSCMLTDAAGNVQDSCRKYPTLRFKILNLFESHSRQNKYLTNLHHKVVKIISKQFYSQEKTGQLPFEVDYLIGACQFFHHSVLEKVGYLDESIFYGPEDADFCLRIHNSELQVVFIPNTSIIHHYSRNSNKKPFSYLSIKHAQGLFHFWWKNRKSLKQDL